MENKRGRRSGPSGRIRGPSVLGQVADIGSGGGPSRLPGTDLALTSSNAVSGQSPSARRSGWSRGITSHFPRRYLRVPDDLGRLQCILYNWSATHNRGSHHGPELERRNRPDLVDHYLGAPEVEGKGILTPCM